MTVTQPMHEAPGLEYFLSQGRRKLAEKYLETKMVAFRFKGDVDPDPSQAPLTAHHPMRDVVAALEDELFSFRPEFIFPFLRDALARFPARLPREDAYPGPLLDEDYGRKVQESIAMLVEHVVMERPDEPFQWLDDWLVGRAMQTPETKSSFGFYTCVRRTVQVRNLLVFNQPSLSLLWFFLEGKGKNTTHTHNQLERSPGDAS